DGIRDFHVTGVQTCALPISLYSMRDGDFSVRLDERADGKAGEVATVFNQVLDHCEQLSSELQRVGEVVRTEGRLTERVSVSPARGAWGKSVRALNHIDRKSTRLNSSHVKIS